jgi:hypothetical protein
VDGLQEAAVEDWVFLCHDLVHDLRRAFLEDFVHLVDQ